MIFDGNLSQWTDFITDFKERVHLKQTISDQMRMEWLLIILRGNEKRSVEIISKGNFFMLLHESH